MYGSPLGEIKIASVPESNESTWSLLRGNVGNDRRRLPISTPNSYKRKKDPADARQKAKKCVYPRCGIGILIFVMG